MSLGASLEYYFCHFGQYGITWRTKMIWLWEVAIVIPQLPCLFSIAKGVSVTLKLVNSMTSESVDSFTFAI
jgi:hypothetical protein